MRLLLNQHDLDADGAQNPSVIQARSFAAGGLSLWVVNIMKYDECYQMITPLRNNLSEAMAKFY